MEQIGLEAILQDSNFQAGLKRYLDGVNKMSSETGKSADSMSRQFVGLGDKVWSVSGQIAKAAAIGFGAITAAAAAAGLASLKAAGDYQEAMSRIQGLTDTTAAQVGVMSTQVLDMARNFPQSAKELASALYFISSSGYQGAQAMDILNASAKAAAAGLGDTKVIADAVTSVLNAYSLSGEKATYATDILTAAVREGKGEPAEFAGALGRVLPIASQAGVSFEQVAASMATMTRTGLSAEEAATALRGTLGALLAPGKQARDALASIGLSADDVRKAIKEKGLLTVLDDLMKRAGATTTAMVLPKEAADELARYQKQLASTEKQIRDYEAGVKGAGQTQKTHDANMSKLYTTAGILREQIAALSGTQKVAVTTERDQIETLDMIIPNIRALTGVLSTAGSQGEEYVKVLGAMEDATGSTNKAFAVAQKNWNFQFKRFGNTIETLGITIGSKLLPTLTPILEKITQAFSSPEVIAGITRFAEQIGTTLAGALDTVARLMSAFQTGGAGGLMGALGITPETQATLTSVFSFLQANLPSIVGALAGIGAVLGGAAIASAIAAIGTAIAAVGAPVLALIGAAALLGAAWNGNWFGIRDTLTKVWQGTLLPALTAIWNWLSTNIPAAIQTLSNFWNNTLMPALNAVWNFISTYMIPLFDALANVWLAIVKKEVEALAGLWQNVLYPALNAVWSFINANILPILNQLWTFISVNLSPILNTLGTVILPAITGAFNGIAGAVQSVIAWLNDLATRITSLSLPSWLTPGSPTPFEEALWGVAGSLSGEGGLIAALSQTKNILENELNRVLGGAAGTISDLEMVRSIAGGAMGSIGEKLAAAFFIVRDAAAEAGSAVGGVLNGLQDIKAMNGLTTHIWIITHEKTIHEPDEEGGGGGSSGGGGGGGPRGRQHGGAIWSTGWWYLHGGEFVLSRAMLRGLGTLLQSQTQMIQSIGQPQPGANIRNISRTVNNNLSVTTMSPYENIVSDFGMMNALAAL